MIANRRSRAAQITASAALGLLGWMFVAAVPAAAASPSDVQARLVLTATNSVLEQPLGQGGNNNNNNNNTPRATPELSSIVLGGAGLLAFGGYALARRRVSRVR